MSGEVTALGYGGCRAGSGWVFFRDLKVVILSRMGNGVLVVPGSSWGASGRPQRAPTVPSGTGHDVIISTQQC